MFKLKSRHLIILLSLIILLQFFWIEFRLRKLYQRSPEYLQALQRKQVEENLAKVAEPEIIPQASGAKLYFKPQQGDFNGTLNLEIWVNSSEPLVEAEVKIFYPPDKLELNDYSWQADPSIGQASWSGRLKEIKEGEFLLTTINFLSLNSGKVDIFFDFSQGSKLDSNLFNIEKKDVLEAVENGSYTSSVITNE